jgi:hypothetical protein
MKALQVAWTNHTSDPITLPPELGSYEIAAGATKTVIHDRKFFKQLVLSGPVLQEQALNDILSVREIVIREDSGVEAAGAAVYNLDARQRVLAGSLRVYVPIDGGGYIELVDTGLGALDEVGGVGTGTINYLTGAIVINNDLDSDTVAAEGAILMSYNRVDVSAVVTQPSITSNGLNDTTANLTA